MKSSQKYWSEKTQLLIAELHSELTLSDKNWHKFKNNSDRRAAELLISAIAQINQGGKKEDIKSLIKQALKWLNNELKDPGCPSH